MNEKKLQLKETIKSYAEVFTNPEMNTFSTASLDDNIEKILSQIGCCITGKKLHEEELFCVSDFAYEVGCNGKVIGNILIIYQSDLQQNSNEESVIRLNYMDIKLI